MQRVKFLKAASGYLDCRTLRYFVKDEIADINDSLVKSFLSSGKIKILEDEKPIIEKKVDNPVVEDKADKKVKKRIKKKRGS